MGEIARNWELSRVGGRGCGGSYPGGNHPDRYCLVELLYIANISTSVLHSNFSLLI